MEIDRATYCEVLVREARLLDEFSEQTKKDYPDSSWTSVAIGVNKAIAKYLRDRVITIAEEAL